MVPKVFEPLKLYCMYLKAIENACMTDASVSFSYSYDEVGVVSLYSVIVLADRKVGKNSLKLSKGEKLRHDHKKITVNILCSKRK